MVKIDDIDFYLHLYLEFHLLTDLDSISSTLTTLTVDIETLVMYICKLIYRRYRHNVVTIIEDVLTMK